ncbi:MAG: type II toxin-antitoxin system RelE/ParE family toxin [Oscillospiraceae bacterium]|nr:type II toxin-antitoxin system RelE/ParE family toxin [Oscillospiraceae bacterium]
MNYEVRITRAAERDLNSSVDYIEHVLLNAQAADTLIRETERAINELTTFPAKNAVVDDPVLKAWGIRFVIIRNYLAFYIISEEEKRVDIVRFLYGKRDWISILKQGFSPA